MITKLEQIELTGIAGVLLRHLPIPQNGGVKESTVVTVEPGKTIPLHKHEVDAHMFIISGSGKVLSENEDHGKEVSPGHCVFFERLLMHGFVAGPDGLVFLSQNGGIHKPDGSFDFQVGNAA